jgi:citrate synthase
MSGVTAQEAADRLGVKLATLYAYVSRGALRSWREPGSRRSRFDPDQIEELARRGRPRRSSVPLALDLVVHSKLTKIADQDLRYRGVSALELAESASFEQVAGWLWTAQRTEEQRSWPAPPLRLPEVGTARDRLRLAVVLLAAGDPLRADLSLPGVVERGQRVISAMAAAAGPSAGRAPASIAGRLWSGLAALPATPGRVGALNAALVLLADHELAASTVAARVAASARADPYSVVLAGIGAMAGSLHGGAPRRARELLEAAVEAGPRVSLARFAEAYGHLPGFGHLLYPGGDPRARLLLGLIDRAAPGSALCAHSKAVISAARETAGVEPNVDLALALLTAVARMPPDAPEVIFTVARTAGWLAHALEEYEEPPLRFRARAVVRA